MLLVAVVLGACGTDDDGSTTNPVNSTSSSTPASSGTTTNSVGTSGERIGVAGSASGLSGTGLVLSLNGANPTNVSGGTFSFPRTLKDGEAFAVTVTTQPSNPTQTCTVDGSGTGTARAGENVSVRVTCVTNVYAVGGRVTGLVGTGLVLRNSGEALTLAPIGGSDVAFVFPTKIASGAGYAITVETSPTGPTETCSVDTKGAGTISAADITDVVITCSTEAYRVGGSVKGLTGSGLTLRVNNQTVAVAAGVGDVRFTAPEKLASGASYGVTVDKQPSSPSQECLVEGSSTGRIASANVASIVVSCTTNSYSVGGQVVGLLGTGLVLRNNGQSLAVGGGPNAAFRFPTKLSSGATYAITVEANPAGPAQICSVDERGAGTIRNAGVSTIVVACSSSAYSVGGRVKGINRSGSGITLRNGGESVFVPAGGGADAPFTFPTALASGASYNVTVDASPFETCTVGNPTGTVSSTDVTTIDVHCTSVAYSVGGRVQGINALGTGITLRTAGQSVFLPASSGTNAPFTFPAKLANGAFYSVTVEGSFFDHCVVNNATGNVNLEDVTRIDVVCSPIAFVGELGAATVTGGASTITITTIAANVAGDTIFVAAGINGNANGALTVTDSAGNLYSNTFVNGVTGSRGYWMLRAKTTAALPAGGTITINLVSPLNAGEAAAATASQFSGLMGAVDRVVSPTTTLVTSASPTVGSAAVTTVPNTVMLAGFYALNSGGAASPTCTPGAGYIALSSVVLDTGVHSVRVCPQYRILSATEALSASATFSTSSPYAAGMAAIR